MIAEVAGRREDVREVAGAAGDLVFGGAVGGVGDVLAAAVDAEAQERRGVGLEVREQRRGQLRGDRAELLGVACEVQGRQGRCGGGRGGRDGRGALR